MEAVKTPLEQLSEDYNRAVVFAKQKATEGELCAKRQFEEITEQIKANDLAVKNGK